jgi:hypothetical protein
VTGEGLMLWGEDGRRPDDVNREPREICERELCVINANNFVLPIKSNRSIVIAI